MDKRKETTLRCVTVLAVIAVVCGVLLAVLYPILYVKPTVESISTNVSAEDLGLDKDTELNWTIDELKNDNAKGKGAAVVMAAKTDVGGETFYGLLIETNKDGKLQECKFAMYFRKSDDKLVKCVIVDDGSTSGRSFDYALGNVKKGSVVHDFEYYYKTIDAPSDALYGTFETPKCGATKTVTAVDNAFRLAADYYFKTYGGSAK